MIFSFIKVIHRHSVFVARNTYIKAKNINTSLHIFANRMSCFPFLKNCPLHLVAPQDADLHELQYQGSCDSLLTTETQADGQRKGGEEGEGIYLPQSFPSHLRLEATPQNLLSVTLTLSGNCFHHCLSWGILTPLYSSAL